jgi:DNA polymerase II large subunit
MQGKLQVLSSILKLERPFRVSHIVDMTGLDRNLVRYHVMQFVEKDYLEKIDRTYVVKDKEGLLNSLVDSADKLETTLPTFKNTFLEEETKLLNRAQFMVACKSLDLPMHEAAKRGMLDQIDATIKDLKQLRKYLTNSTKTVGSAQKFMKSMGGYDPEWMDAAWHILVTQAGGDISVDYPEFEKAYKRALIEE